MRSDVHDSIENRIFDEFPQNWIPERVIVSPREPSYGSIGLICTLQAGVMDSVSMIAVVYALKMGDKESELGYGR